MSPRSGTAVRGWRRGLLLASALGAALASSGCIIVADDDHHHDFDDDGYVEPVYDDPATVAIDVGAHVGRVEPGFGTGLFVEVDEGGLWHLFVTCDTELSGYACGWEVDVRAEDVEWVDDDGLGLEDEVDVYDDDGLYAYLENDVDVDGVWFTTTPGAAIELTMLLDGASQPTFVYWVGGGVQNEGAPTNPIVFLPE